MIELINVYIKLSTVNINYKKYDKRTKNLRIYIIDAGSNNKTVPKTICLAFRYDEAPVAP